MSRTSLPGGGWADPKALLAGWLDEPSAPEQAVQADLEPGVECLRCDVPIRCNCPRHVVAEVVMLRHREDCEERHPNQAATLPGPPRLHGAIRCPRCGNVAFSLSGRNRRCDGPASCGNVWNPEAKSSDGQVQRPVRLAS